MNTIPEARKTLLATLHAASSDRHAQSAIRAHRVLKLREPTLEEIGAYRKSNGKANIYRVCAESLLSLRGKKRPKGCIRRAVFGKEVERLLLGSAKAKDAEHGKMFGELACSFSRLIAVHYEDGNGRQPERVDRELGMVLPHLAGHLMAELELAMEAGFPRAANSLCKASVFDIQAKLDMLEDHPEEIVNANARSILCAALNVGNLGLADTLAAGARAKLDMLEEHPERAVSANARTILSAVLIRGNLALADRLAKRAGAKLKKLRRGARIVRANANSIVSAALARGNLGLTGTFAAWAKAEFKALRKHPDPIVRANARIIISVSIAKGSPALADRLAKGAQKTFGELKAIFGDGEAAETQLSMMLAAGTLDVDAYLKKGAS